jgi:hypothetical protein
MHTIYTYILYTHINLVLLDLSHFNNKMISKNVLSELNMINYNLENKHLNESPVLIL